MIVGIAGAGHESIANPEDIVSDDGLGNVTDTSHGRGIQLHFHDTAGRAWVRDELGRLHAGREVPLGASDPGPLGDGTRVTAKSSASARN